ncbi:uncharacterized protein ColSpa_08151 [Colletotrichum spaethianum]|uniref:Uncharacterized protein n=1 Tax=Colletotrichum spaethianum TaxID=700344 RepID=A0AA37UN76_9PEZI|nr:uncharacterized protein ColSpa_08151 [Colletotrichum spaethianum]GKT47970.1 hypothetical protein ColSpa_08151 [Colletotrichum spaethianum]
MWWMGERNWGLGSLLDFVDLLDAKGGKRREERMGAEEGFDTKETGAGDESKQIEQGRRPTPTPARGECYLAEATIVLSRLPESATSP